eukprot:447672-Pyramimonas_sp.AAC.1
MYRNCAITVPGQVWKDAGGILALVRLLEKAVACADRVLIGRAVMALLNASSNSRANKLEIVNEGGVDLLLHVLNGLLAGGGPAQ